MRFALPLGLLLTALVALPIIAQMFRRKRTTRRTFAGTAFLVAADGQNRTRHKLTDKWLGLVRVLTALALAFLAAAPMVRCSRLSLGRADGSSVAFAVVLDNSLSMATTEGGKTRFAKAKAGALDLLASAKKGDRVAILRAGKPVKVLLAPTGDFEAAKEVLAAVEQGDAAADLDESLKLAEALLQNQPQKSKRIVLLSDLRAGSDRKAALHQPKAVPVWLPLSKWDAKEDPNCGFLSAIRRSNELTVRVKCTHLSAAAGRKLQVAASAGDKGKGKAGTSAAAPKPLQKKLDQTLSLPWKGSAVAGTSVELTGGDGIERDNKRLVTNQTSETRIAIISDPEAAGTARKGKSTIERALTALDPDLVTRPLPDIPSHLEDLRDYAAIVIDNPPGLGPGARAALSSWLKEGGIGLLFLGPKSDAAMLGSNFEPFVGGPVRWQHSRALGGCDKRCVKSLGGLGVGMEELAAKGRARVDQRQVDAADILLRWRDQKPLLFRARARGKSAAGATDMPWLQPGQGLVVTLPSDAATSDLPLRPGFLKIMQRFAETAKGRTGGRVSNAGEVWSFDAKDAVSIRNAAGKEQALIRTAKHRRFALQQAGEYQIKVRGQSERRWVLPAEEELNPGARPAPKRAQEAELGTSAPLIDTSKYIAMVILAALAFEIGLRLWAGRNDAQPALS